MRNNLEQLKNAAARSKKEKAKKKQHQEQRHHHRELPPAPSTSKPIPKQPKPAPKKNKKKVIPDDDVLTFEQKKDLSETIGTLEGAKLEKVINIIHEGVPEIRDVSFGLAVRSSQSDKSCRAQRRLNSKSIPFPPVFLPSFTTLSFVH